jgi:hypothetical protein
MFVAVFVFGRGYVPSPGFVTWFTWFCHLVLLPQQSLKVSLLEVPVIGEGGVNSVLPHYQEARQSVMLQFLSDLS